jgi:photosystem II stability/assembly factor-like uncharacterized protein
MEFINSSQGMCLDVQGTVLTTSDGGQQWNQFTIIPDSTYTFARLRIINTTTAFAIDNRGGIYKTDDFGTTWNNVTRSIDDSFDHGAFATKTKLFLLGTSPYHTNTTVYSFQTNTRALDSLYVFPGRSLNAITSSNNDRIFVGGDDGFLASSHDAGATWKDTIIDTQVDLHDMIFISEQVGFIIGSNNTVLKTIDQGKSWQKKTVNANMKDFPLKAISFCDENRGFITFDSLRFSYPKEFIYTENGGETWNGIFVFDKLGVKELLHVSSDKWFFVNDEGALYQSDGDPNQWESYSELERYFYEFTTNNVVDWFALKYVPYQKSYAIFGSNDTGHNWKEQVQSSVPLHRIISNRDSILVTLGSKGTIWQYAGDATSKRPGNGLAKQLASPGLIVASLPGGRLRIAAHVPENKPVTIHIYSIMGKKIASLSKQNNINNAGSFLLNNIPPGYYISVLSVGGAIASKLSFVHIY